MFKRAFETIGAMAAAALLSGVLQAAEVQVGGQGGTVDPPDPGELCGANCDVEIDWNPHVDCSDEYTDLDSLVTCMLNAPQRSSSSFVSTPLAGAPWGVLIKRELTFPWTTPPTTYQVEIDRLEIYENDRAIATTQLLVDRGELVVRIGEIIEGPDPVGVITIEIDDDLVQVEENDDWMCSVTVGPGPPTNYISAIDFNVAISQGLRGTGCDLDVMIDVTSEGSFFVITGDRDFRRVYFNSSNAGVIKSDIALLPEDDPELEHLLLPD